MSLLGLPEQSTVVALTQLALFVLSSRGAKSEIKEAGGVAPILHWQAIILCFWDLPSVYLTLAFVQSPSFVWVFWSTQVTPFQLG